MAKTRTPLFSFEAHGRLGKSTIYGGRSRKKFARAYAYPHAPLTPPQIAQRGYMQNAVSWAQQQWLDPIKRANWRTAQQAHAPRLSPWAYALQEHLTGFPHAPPGWSILANQILHYKLNDDLPSTDVLDAMDNAHGILTGGQNTQDLSETGRINAAFHLNGAGDSVYLPDHPLYDVNTISAFAWIYIHTFIAHNTIISRDTGYIGNRLFWFGTLGGGTNRRLQLVLWNTADQRTLPIGNTQLALSTWHHVGFTYDGTVTKLWLDADLDATTTDLTGPVKTGTLPIHIGEQLYLGIHRLWLNGLIDDVRYLNRALTQPEITGLYNDGNGTEKDRP